MLADIFITYKDREDLFERSFRSFVECTPREQYRLTVVCDGGGVPSIVEGHDCVDHVLVHRDNLGLGPSINQALGHIDTLNKYYEDPNVGDASRVTQFICYCQSDLLYTPGWLPKLMRFFLIFKGHNLGFASGMECVEHEVRTELPNGMLLKDWIRAAQMFAPREYWMSMWPIPRYDPETRSLRAKPNDGMGSGVDWWFIRNHPNSVCNSGRTNLVIPGLVKHLGYRDSTWLDRELPESESDKETIEKCL